MAGTHPTAGTVRSVLHGLHRGTAASPGLRSSQLAPPQRVRDDELISRDEQVNAISLVERPYRTREARHRQGTWSS